MTILSEFLDCYIILGFNTEGQDVRIAFSHNTKEACSLSTLVNDFAAQLREPPPQSPPENS